jgi:hypothetical protein
MKLRLLLALMACLSLLSCSEKGPAIDLGKLDFSDSSYMASPEAPEPHRVAVEEFTGATCPNCPDARVELATKSAANPGRILVIAIHPFNFAQSQPVKEISTVDFRTQKGTDLLTQVYGSVVGIPIAGIDRVPRPPSADLALFRSFWDAAINARLATTVPVNISVTSTYNSTTGKARIKVRLAYTQAISYAHALTLAITEDSVVNPQENQVGIDTFYVFEHSLRDYVTSITGQSVLPGTAKTAGLVYEAVFNYPVNPAWVPRHCHVIAFVNRADGTSKEILQAAEARLSE